MIQPSSISGSGTLVEKLAGVGMLRRREHHRGVALLDEPAGRQHRDPVAEHADDRQVVADEDQRQVELGAESSEEEQDLRLGRDVEARDDLVGDDELGLERERAGDADPLALAAGNLVRVAAEKRSRQADDVEQFRRAPLAAGRCRRRGRTLRAAASASCRW